MKAQVFVLCGLPGAGKSTWCSGRNLPVVSRDILRAELGFIKLGEKAALTKEQEMAVTAAEYRRIARLCSEGRSFIVDDTNIGGFYRDELLTHLRAHHAVITGVNFRTPLCRCLERRQGQMPLQVIFRMAKRLSFLTASEADRLIEIN